MNRSQLNSRWTEERRRLAPRGLSRMVLTLAMTWCLGAHAQHAAPPLALKTDGPITPATLSISMVPKLVITGTAGSVQEVKYPSENSETANQWLTLTSIVLSDTPYVLHCGPRTLPHEMRVSTAWSPSPRQGPDPARWSWIEARHVHAGQPRHRA